MIFGHPMFHAYFLTAFFASVGIQLSQLGPTFISLANNNFRHILNEIHFAIHSLVHTKILLNRKVVINVESFVTHRAHIYFFVLFGIFRTWVGLNGWMVSTIYLFAIFASDGEPVFLFAGVEGAVFTYVLIEHLKYF